MYNYAKKINWSKKSKDKLINFRKYELKIKYQIANNRLSSEWSQKNF